MFNLRHPPQVPRVHPNLFLTWPPQFHLMAIIPGSPVSSQILFARQSCVSTFLDKDGSIHLDLRNCTHNTYIYNFSNGNFSVHMIYNSIPQSCLMCIN
jgi:hypothetical protein